jgi:hypothetical protein
MIADNSSEFPEASVDSASFAITHSHVCAIETDIGTDYACSEVGSEAEDGVAHIIKMGNLAIVEEQAVFKFTRVAKGAVVACDDIGSNVGATSYC